MLDNSEEKADKVEKEIVDNTEISSENVETIEEKVEETKISTDEIAAVDENTAEISETVTAIATEDVKEAAAEVTAISEQEEASSEEAVDAVEDKVAEEAEKVAERHTIPMLDYETMELEDLVVELEKLIKNNPVQQIKTNADAIKNAFNTKFGALLASKKAAFLADGGNSIDFQFYSPVKVAYNKLLGEYKAKRDVYYGALEKQLKENLEKRNQVISELKELIAHANDKTMYNEFKALDKRWREIGPVPKTKYNDTWKIYHHHVERFYDLLHLNQDFRALDFKHNLEEKLKLIARAEALTAVEDVNEAFKELQKIHKIWKEDIGPVDREHREEVWQKFSAATKLIHDKRHEYFKVMKTKYQEIIDAKLVVIESINAYDTSNNKSHKDWQKSIAEIEVLRQEYFNAGKLPFSRSEAVWQKFKNATKKFNSAKNDFYKQEKGSQNDNLKQKMALIELAESLKDSDDWENATNQLKKVQSDWKKIGHVPRKFSDDIWKRFKSACNHYFDRLHERKNELNNEQQVVVDAKKEFLENVKATENATLESIQETISTWKELGKLPFNLRHLEGRFNKQIDKMLEGLSLSKEEITMLKYKNVIEGYIAQEDYRKIESEQFFLRKKIDETVRDMQQLENNLSFISNATEDNPFVINVRAGINAHKEELDVWQMKLNYIKKLDY